MKSVYFIHLYFATIWMFSTSVFAQTSVLPSFQTTIAGFENAVLAKDTTLLSGIIADNFAISTSTWPASAQLLQRIWDRPQSIEFIRLATDNPVQSSKNQHRVAVLIKETNKDSIQTHVTLNEKNQIIYVDYFDELYGRYRYQESRLRACVPIERLDSSYIILTIRLNDNPRKLRFLFDSGADGMAISKTLADTLGLKVNHNRSASVVGGTMDIAISSDNTVYLDTLQLQGQNIALFDKIHQGVDGIIGLNLAKSFITRFDLDQQQLFLYEFGTYTYEKVGETVEVTLPRNIPIISASLNLTGNGAVDGNFAFDSGANYHLIAFSPFVRKNKLLVSGFKPESQSTTVSMGRSTPTFNGKCFDFRLNSIHIQEMPVVLQGGSNWDAGADGSIGVKFISNFNFTINLLQKEIHLAPRMK